MRMLQGGMHNDILATIAGLTDDELAAQVKTLATRERDANARLIAHLAEMDTRDIHLREGYPRLYDYCLNVLHLSEWEAWNRIEVGRVARRFPVIFEMLEEGSIHLTGVKLLAPHLTPENHRRVLESARWKSKLAIGEIVACLHPLPDVPTSVIPILAFAVVPDATTAAPSAPSPAAAQGPAVAPAPPRAAPPNPPVRPATLTPLAPKRYKLQLTISDETLEKLRRAKDLLGHAVPAGDDDAVLNRALTVLLDKLAREKCAQTDKPRPGRSRSPRARRPSAAVKRIVWQRDVAAASTPRRAATAARRHVASSHTTSTPGPSPATQTTRTISSCVASGTTTMKDASTSASGDAATAEGRSVRGRFHTVRVRSALY
jgi:hypothetical protein